jgi:hypothetical protein
LKSSLVDVAGAGVIPVMRQARLYHLKTAKVVPEPMRVGALSLPRFSPGMKKEENALNYLRN